MKRLIKILALNMMFIATVFLLTGCNSSQQKSTSQDIDNHAIKAQAQKKLDALQEQKGDFSFPSWLAKLNITEPKGLELDKIKSQKTTEKVEGFNSIHFVYKGDYDTAMKQASIIAKKAHIDVSPEFKMAQNIITSMDMTGDDGENLRDMLGDMKGIVYTNFSLLDKKSPDYTIAITVNEDGSLELDVTDMLAMKKVTDQYIAQY